MQGALAEAVLQTLHDRPTARQRELLAGFSAQAWAESYRWLDASGLALYFLDQVKRLGARLEQNLADNQARTAEMFAEFERINRALIEAGVVFVNVKGIALTPHACPDPALRHQLDLDFMARESDAERCREVVTGFGYVMSGTHGRTWEFKTPSTVLPRIEEMYRVKPQRSVEFHFEPEERLERRGWKRWGGFDFTVLHECDAFLLQAGHLFKHLRHEWMRLSWLLEFRRSVVSKLGDETFWQELRAKTEADAAMRTAIGAGIALATSAFGEFAPKELTAWTVAAMDRRTHLWLSLYGRQVMLADFPGTKLYLLLPYPEAESARVATRVRWAQLVPLRKPAFMVQGASDEGFRERMRRCVTQMGYVRLRLRFHVVEGLRYLLEAPRWKKIAGPVQ